jgi:hypothetical protein
MNKPGDKLMTNKLTKKEYQEAMQTGIDLMINMDPVLRLRMQEYAKKLDIPLWIVIQNILLKDWAKKMADILVNGPQPGKLAPEFSRKKQANGNIEAVTGKELYEFLLKTYKKELLQQKVDKIIKEIPKETLLQAGKDKTVNENIQKEIKRRVKEPAVKQTDK